MPPLLIVAGPATNVIDGEYGEEAAAATPLSSAARRISAVNASIDLNVKGSLVRLLRVEPMRVSE